MSDTFVCAAPAGIDGSGRVRVPALPSGRGGAMHTGARGIERAASLAPLGTTRVGTSAQPVGTPTPSTQPFGTTSAYTTLGNHPPGRPQS